MAEDTVEGVGEVRVGSLFSGIGGFDLGFERAGMTVAWQCEAEPSARRILARHWPDVTCYPDVKELSGGSTATVDVLCGGFPCQDLSVAGKRAGLAGERSRLFHEFVRLADELAPRWVVIENVPGLLSSEDGRDMGVVVGTLADLGYGWAYRVLDAQYFGVAQRRRRVFIVGCAGGRADRACQVLFEPESCSGDTPPSRGPGEGIAGTLAACAGTGGYGGIGQSVSSITSRLTVSPPITSKWAKGTGGPAVYEMEVTNALAMGGGKPGQGYPAVRTGMAVRRLLPLECERLQGFPDGWTEGGLEILPSGIIVRECHIRQLANAAWTDALGPLLTGSAASALCTTSGCGGTALLIYRYDRIDAKTRALSANALSVTTERVAGAPAATSPGNGTAIQANPDDVPNRSTPSGRDTQVSTAATDISLSLNLSSVGLSDQARSSITSTWTNATTPPRTSGSTQAVPPTTPVTIRWSDSPPPSSNGESFVLRLARITSVSDSSRYARLGNAVAVPVAEWIGRRLVDVDQGGALK